MRLAVISELSLEDLIDSPSKLRIGTPHGPAILFSGRMVNEELVFLPRDGEKHDIPFHRVNYRANVRSLHKLGIDRILSIDGVRATTSELKLGDFVIPHDLVDLTKSRPVSFYDEAPVTRIDLTSPYCPELRSILVETVEEAVGRAHQEAVYACVEGPRSETLAEVKTYSRLGCEIVSAVGMPEPALARELGICYASLCLVVNLDKSLKEPFEVIRRSKPLLKSIVEKLVKRLPDRKTCKCSRA